LLLFFKKEALACFEKGVDGRSHGRDEEGSRFHDGVLGF
jgi:hypothetical protein